VNVAIVGPISHLGTGTWAAVIPVTSHGN